MLLLVYIGWYIYTYMFINTTVPHVNVEKCVVCV